LSALGTGSAKLALSMVCGNSMPRPWKEGIERQEAPHGATKDADDQGQASTTHSSWQGIGTTDVEEDL
jgi:hypothetical protein